MSLKFGYQIINGKYMVNVTQADIVTKTMYDYINGMSLNDKAKELTNQGVEYAPGKSLWNRNRVQRMLTDNTYIGLKNYPAIISEDIFEEVAKVMYSRNTQKHTNRQEILSSSIVSIRCSKCGCETFRKLESRTKEHKVYHICNNPHCNKKYIINDMDLRMMVKDKLVQYEEILPTPSDELLSEVRRLNNEIARELQFAEIDETTIKNKILQCAALEYSCCSNPKESIDYGKMDLCSLDFNRAIKQKIKAIYIENNDEIWLYMTDGQIVGKDVSTFECCI